MSTVLLPRSFAVDPDDAMRRVAPLLGVREWVRHENKYEPGGWRCTAHVLGFFIIMSRYDPHEEFAEQYEFVLRINVAQSSPNLVLVIDDIAHSIANRLAYSGIHTATLKVDRDKVPHLVAYPTSSAELRLSVNRAADCSVGANNIAWRCD